MRLRNILAALGILLCFFGCRSEEDETVPDALIGVWKTSTPGYEDNSLELRKDQILFGVTPTEFNVNSVFKVETVRLAGEKTSLITIYYTDEEGKDNASSIYYDETPPGSIRFKNQMQIEWRLFQRKPVVRGSLSPRRPESPWGERSGLNMAVALLGVALTIGAILWRWQKLRAEKAAATVENVEARSAQQIRADREPSRMRFAEGRTDWTQAPTTFPAAAAEGQRRSERVLLRIPVHVSGIDVHGKSFGERAFTISVNRYGAFIWLKHSPREGDRVIVTNLGTCQSCEFRLCEFTKAPSGQGTAWGIECLDPNSNFWQIRFPEKPPEPSPQENITALVVCATCHSREVAELSVAQYRNMVERGSMKRDCPGCGAATEWEFILVEATAAASPQETPGVSLPSGEEHRREKRIVAKLPIRLRHPGDGRVENTLTENVSKSGVCCAASMELKADDVILLTFMSGAGPSADENPARIMWRRPMGENRKTLYGIRLERKDLVGRSSRVL
ncbi:MAG: PilZ domain-containing protein [Acidobacteriia bacterium]|nr:PilZ domain-containing protein [Terriglobia bacterium]